MNPNDDQPTPKRPSAWQAVAVTAWALVTAVLMRLGGPLGEPAVLWPSLAAVLLAFMTREIYSSLFLGALAGSFLLRGTTGAGFLESVVLGWIDLFSVHMLGSLTSRWNIAILAFTLIMGGLVEVLHQNGSMQALADRMLRSDRSRRRAGLGTFGMGFLVFFDGLANSMLVGKTMRATADRAGMSREKLAFIVDSTSSPIASVALISTWIVTEMSLIREGLDHLSVAMVAGASPYGLLLASLPFRFYAYFLLMMVFLSIWLQRDIGPMIDAEKAGRTAPAARDDHPPKAQHSGRIWLAVLPLAVLISSVFGGLFIEGGGLAEPRTWTGVTTAFGRAQADLVFVCASATSVLVAISLTWLADRTGSPGSTGAPQSASGLRAFLDGMQQMFLPALILVFAWTLNAVIKELGTATYLVQALDDQFPALLFPAAVFLLSALVSFSTGTSWGTMAIIVPLVVPLGAGLAGTTAGPLLPAAIGAVLAGAVFGDHCSPISDTTIVSAFASDCDPMDHVRTQIPYALVVAGVAVGLGYLPAAAGIPTWFLLPLGGLACWILLRFAGTPATTGA